MSSTPTTLRTQVGGTHYQMPFQHVDFCETNGIGWCVSCVLKYTVRFQNKNGFQDLLKAIHYLEIFMEFKFPKQFAKWKQQYPKLEPVPSGPPSLVPLLQHYGDVLGPRVPPEKTLRAFVTLNDLSEAAGCICILAVAGAIKQDFQMLQEARYMLVHTAFTCYRVEAEAWFEKLGWHRQDDGPDETGLYWKLDG